MADATLAYFKNLDLSEDNAPLPKELEGTNPDNVYQFFYKNTCRYNTYSKLYGFSVVEDDASSTGKAAKLGYNDAVVLQEIVALNLTSREVKDRKGLAISIIQDDKCIDKMELFKEDLVPDEYHLYKLGSVSGIKNSANTRINIFGTNFEWLSLTGISVLFPMDECDIYLSMKFTGEIYGGKADEPQAIYLDRAIVVRK